MVASAAWNQLALSSLLAAIGSDTTQPAPGVMATTSINAGLVKQTTVASASVIINEASHAIAGTNPAVNGDALWTPGGDLTLALTPLDATNPRVSKIVAFITDPGSSTTPILCDIQEVAGTPAASPATPATPTGANLLATIAVPAGASSVITSAMITDNRLFTGVRGALWFVPDRAKVSSPYVGCEIFENSTGQRLTYNGGVWIPTPGFGSGTQLRNNSKVTANQGAITGVVDITGSSLSLTLVSGRKYELSAQGIGLQSTVAGDGYQVQALQGAGSIGQARNICPTANTLSCSWSIGPIEVTGSGATTFKLQAQRVTGTGTLTNVASASAPTVLRVVDVGGV